MLFPYTKTISQEITLHFWMFTIPLRWMDSKMNYIYTCYIYSFRILKNVCWKTLVVKRELIDWKLIFLENAHDSILFSFTVVCHISWSKFQEQWRQSKTAKICLQEIARIVTSNKYRNESVLKGFDSSPALVANCISEGKYFFFSYQKQPPKLFYEKRSS